jgi:large subunit ribosomal protein LP0
LQQIPTNQMSSKQNQFHLFQAYSETYKNIIILDFQHVDSNQFKTFRNFIQDFGKLLTGKNSIFINAIKSSKNEKLKLLLPHIKNQICFIFTNEDLHFFNYCIQMTEMFSFQEPGSIAEEDIIIKSHNTYLEPHEYAQFFMGKVPFKISQRYTIEFMEDFVFIKKGKKLEEIHCKILKLLGMETQRNKFDIIAIYEDGEIFGSPEKKDFKKEMDILLKESIENVFQIAKAADYLFVEKKIELIENEETSSEESLWSLFF